MDGSGRKVTDEPHALGLNSVAHVRLLSLQRNTICSKASAMGSGLAPKSLPTRIIGMRLRWCFLHMLTITRRALSL
jgi:hypothetical protein